MYPSLKAAAQARLVGKIGIRPTRLTCYILRLVAEVALGGKIEVSHFHIAQSDASNLLHVPPLDVS
jgi:hypothetical protein